jgi:hypothetical protein
MPAPPVPRRLITITSALLVAVLLGAIAASAAGTGTVEPPPRTAFVARADNPADALAAGPIAGRLGAPLFTTPSNVLDAQAREGLVAYAPALIILTGGTAALSADVEAQVSAAVPGATVRRVFGAGRTETARRLAELIGEYNPAFLPVDATALDSDHLDGYDATAFMPHVLLSDAGAIAMADGSEQCITEPYSPDVDRVAVAQIGLSGRHAAAGAATLFARWLVSTDDGVTWETVSGRISPEDQISGAVMGAISYSDAMALTAGTTYRFAVRVFGGDLDLGRCNMVITATVGAEDQLTFSAFAAADEAAEAANDR